MLKSSRHQSEKKLMNLVHIVNIRINIHYVKMIMLIVKYILLNMIAVGKVSLYIDFHENEVMPLLHGTLQFMCCLPSCITLLIPPSSAFDNDPYPASDHCHNWRDSQKISFLNEVFFVNHLGCCWCLFILDGLCCFSDPTFL